MLAASDLGVLETARGRLVLVLQAAEMHRGLEVLVDDRGLLEEAIEAFPVALAGAAIDEARERERLREDARNSRTLRYSATAGSRPRFWGFACPR